MAGANWTDVHFPFLRVATPGSGLGCFSPPARGGRGPREQRQAAYKPGSVPVPYRGRGRPFIWDARCRTPRATYPGGAAETPLAAPVPLRRPAGRPPLCGLAPGGVCPAAAVAGGAVRSYRTISPLPAVRSRGTPAVCFCGTFPEVALAGRYPAPCSRGARTFLPPAVASRKAAVQPPDTEA